MSPAHRPIRCRVPLAISAVLLLGACQTLPKDAFRLPESALETRQIQTWRYEDVSETEILSASVGVLQDLGYAIDEVERELGVLSASKRADASNPAQTAGRIALDVTSCLMTLFIACDNENYKKSDAVQDIRVTLVVLPVHEADSAHSVRVTMQRIIWDRDGRVSEQSTISEPEVYQAFFSKLDKSVFLEKEGA